MHRDANQSRRRLRAVAARSWRRVVTGTSALALALASLTLAPSPAAACDPAIDPNCYDDPYYADDPYYDHSYSGDPYYDDTYSGDPYYDDTYYDDTYYDDTYYDDTYYDETTSPTSGMRSTSPTSAAVRMSGTTPVTSANSGWSYSRSDAVDAIAPSALPAVNPAPAGEPTDADSTSLRRSIAGRLVLATDALAELGAFSRDEDPLVSQAIADLARTVPSAGLVDDGYRSELASLTQEFPALVAQLDTELSDAVLVVLDVLDSDTISRLDDGDMAFIEPLPWLEAIADVLMRGGGPLMIESDEAFEADDDAVIEFVSLFADPDVFVVEEPVVAVPSTTVTTEPNLALIDQAVEEPAVTNEGPVEGDTSPTLLLGILAAVVAAAAALAFVFKRQSPGAADDDRADAGEVTSAVARPPTEMATLPIAPMREEPGSLIELLDASRRMTASLDTREIASIAVAEARSLVDAEGGMLLRRSAEVVVPTAAEPSALFSSENLESSILRRVVDTGRAHSSVTSEDPALVDVPAAMAAVAIVASGSVIGALMVVRRPSRPFRSDEVEALEMLAPLVGSALLAAETHGSATALADLDALTGLANRRSLDRDIAALRPSHVASYVMIDVDHFKNFNDTNGHAAGDLALQTVARAIEANVRPEDRVYRYGGEEFCVLLPGASSIDAAMVAERVRSAVEGSRIPGGEHQPGGCVTISIGVADTEVGIADIIERADGALYQAKESGRNRVNIAGAKAD